MTKKKIVLLHFQPLELYPPVMNMIDFLSKECQIQLNICTQSVPKKFGLVTYKINDSKVIINRTKSWSNLRWKRVLQHVNINLTSLIKLIKLKPTSIIYYESISSFVPILYKKVINKKVAIFCHYHEYTSIDEYKSGMKLIKWFHNLEMRNYTLFEWISHTNSDRIAQFQKDNISLNIQQCVLHVLPNYPPISWVKKEKPLKISNNQKKIVYLGSLSVQNFYLTEIISWVVKNEITLDIYSHNITIDAINFIKNMHSPFIQIKGSIQYFEIPNILSQYDIGVILYRPISVNYIYNAPNKLFEYIACGLDVWIPSHMKFEMNNGMGNISSMIKSIDFEELYKYDKNILETGNRSNYIENDCFYENKYKSILQKLI